MPVGDKNPENWCHKKFSLEGWRVLSYPANNFFFGEETLLEGILINYLLRYILRSQIFAAHSIRTFKGCLINFIVSETTGGEIKINLREFYCRSLPDINVSRPIGIELLWNIILCFFLIKFNCQRFLLRWLCNSACLVMQIVKRKVIRNWKFVEQRMRKISRLD